MVVYDIKDSVGTCKTLFTHVCMCKHWKNKKCRLLHPNYGIRVSYFQSGPGEASSHKGPELPDKSRYEESVNIHICQ